MAGTRANGKEKKVRMKGSSSPAFKIYCALFFIVCFIVPFCLANFVEGGDEFLTTIGPFVGGLIFSLLINWFRWSKHITAVELEDADDYAKKEDTEITYRYDEYTHTS